MNNSNRDVLFETNWFKLVRDKILLKGNKQLDYTYLVHPGSVFIAPVTLNNEIILIQSYRHTLGKFCWEVPAGTMADRQGVSPEEVAAEELREETGAGYEELIPLGTFYMSNGFANAPGHFFLAKGCRILQAASPEPGEFISRITSRSKEEVISMIQQGDLMDGDSAFAILLASRMF